MVPCLLSGYLGGAGVLPGEEVRSGGPWSMFPLRASEHQARKHKQSLGQAASSLTGASTKYWRGRREQAWSLNITAYLVEGLPCDDR